MKAPLMITRKAIIISNPGEKGDEDYCEGVNKDIENYDAYLHSSTGGAWDSKEIKTLYKPRPKELRYAFEELPLCDYGLIVFSGHGHYSTRTQSTILSINGTDDYDSSEFYNTACLKLSIILDCCRKERYILREFAKAVEILEKSGSSNRYTCRRHYNERIEECDPGIVVMHACSINEYSYDDPERGGYYSSSLIHNAKKWAESDFGILSVSKTHIRACSDVIRMSGGRQHPQIEKPRSATKFFPFAVKPVPNLLLERF